LPSLATDVIHHVIEILQIFNSRTCQLVLGAGAMQIPRLNLKSITAKHLALASQCLSLQIVLIPCIRHCLQLYIPPKQSVLLNEIDRILQDFVNHQQEIHQKFVVIMRERVQYHCRLLKALDWNECLPQPSVPVTALVKETTTLHRVLSQLLPLENVNQIFANVILMLNSRLIENFHNFTISTTSGKLRFVNDVSYLMESIQNLCTLENINASHTLKEYFKTYFELSQVPN